MGYYNAIAAKAPYRPPPVADFHRLNKIFAAKHSEIVDYIQLLKQYPGYFLNGVLEYGERLPEQILDVEGNPVSSLNTQDLWEFVIRNVCTYILGASLSHVQCPTSNGTFKRSVS